jgi:predicted ATP-grasp superfamily ATP-dependent carboligase
MLTVRMRHDEKLDRDSTTALDPAPEARSDRALAGPAQHPWRDEKSVLPDRPIAEPSGIARTVIVTDANHSISIPFIRSLGRRGWHVVAASPERNSLGLRSRYAAHRLIYPSPGRQPAAFVEALAIAATHRRADLIMPLSETAVVALTRHRNLLPRSVRVAMADSQAFEVALDKRRTLALALELSIPVPRTAVGFQVAHLVEEAARMHPPFVLKPSSPRRRIRGHSRLGTLHARDLHQVASQAARLLPDDDGVLIQEFVPGHGVGVNLLMRDGRPVLAFQHRRLRELPVWGGASALRESVPLDPNLLSDATALLGALRWTGLAMVEFRVAQDGYHLMEINGRAWGSIALAVAAGVDFPAAAAELALEDGDDRPSATEGATPSPAIGQPAAPPPYEIGVRSRNLQLDVLWVVSVLARRPRQAALPWPARRDAVRVLVQLLNPIIRFDVLSRDDPRPGAAEVLHIARHLIRQIVRR